MATKPFGERVRAQRIQEGLSQDELARRVGISRNYLSQIERGDATNLSWPIMHRLATELGLTVEQSSQELPPGLAEFAQTVHLPPDDIAMLSRLQYRGRQPTTAKEWSILYNVIKATIGNTDQE
ncbi:MAG: hypothetical protein CYG59_22615 [Chloroflexi bacterium]|nr:MAG: hypothetical protein CYG59_22615 [Chloroflexota bacterium]